MKEYKVVNGTSYDVRTPDEVIRVLENARQGGYRIHVSLGYVNEADAADGVGRKEVGLDWLEEHMTTGYVGRSTGSVKIPLIVHNSRSFGGPGLLDASIVRIRLAKGGRVLYQHPKYHHGKIEIRRKIIPSVLSDGRQLTVEVLRDGEEQAAFETMAKARHYVNKLGLQAEVVGLLDLALAE